MKNLVGNKYNKLTVVSHHSVDKNGHKRYLCKCDCGKEKSILGTHLISGKIKSCGCEQYKRGIDHAQWGGIGEMSGDFWNKLRRCERENSKRVFKKEFTLTKEFVWDLYLKQNKLCALSGVYIYFPLVSKGAYTASLDRIDNSLGYIEGNVQWVHKDINMMKRIYSNEYFIELCKLVANTNKDN